MNEEARHQEREVLTVFHTVLGVAGRYATLYRILRDALCWP